MPSFDISITNLYTSNASTSFTGWPISIKTYKFKVLKQTKNYLITLITNFGDINISSDLCVISLQIQYSLIKLYVLFRPTKRQIRLNWMLKKWKTSHHVFRQKTDPTAEVSTCYWILYVEAGIYIKEIMENGISDMYKTYLTVLLFSTSSAIKEHSSEGRVCILPLIWMQGGRDEEERIPPPPPQEGK